MVSVSQKRYFYASWRSSANAIGDAASSLNHADFTNIKPFSYLTANFRLCWISVKSYPLKTAGSTRKTASLRTKTGTFSFDNGVSCISRLRIAELSVPKPLVPNPHCHTIFFSKMTPVLSCQRTPVLSGQSTPVLQSADSSSPVSGLQFSSQRTRVLWSDGFCSLVRENYFHSQRKSFS